MVIDEVNEDFVILDDGNLLTYERLAQILSELSDRNVLRTVFYHKKPPVELVSQSLQTAAEAVKLLDI